jgi:hypothetical protein
MEPLTKAQTEYLRQQLAQGGIRDPLLQADLLDHCCCYVEERLTDDAAFTALCTEALQTLAPGGLQELEEERYFLFHYHKQLTMKKILFLSAFSTTFLVSTGIMLRIMHWPLANVLLLSGFVSLLITATLIQVQAWKTGAQHTPAYRLRITAGVLAAFLVGIGHIFKILHIPSANILAVLGAGMLNFVFLPLFFYHLYRRSAADLHTAKG